MTPKNGNRFSVAVMPTQKAAVSVQEAQSLFNDLADSRALVLAVSGGPDSTALMLLAARWAKARKKSPRLIAVTVDHGLRTESAREAAAVRRQAAKLGIEHRTLRWTGRKPKTGLQEAAREARYRLLGEAAREAGASCILTAHTLDDQAETVLIRLTRGSGLTGLAAMQRVTPLGPALGAPSPHGTRACPSSDLSFASRASPTCDGEGWGGGVAAALKKTSPSRRASRVDLPRKGGGDPERPSGASNPIYLVRPLLGIPKARLVATLKAAGISFADDPSNRDPRFTRVRVRGLMPALAGEGLDARRLALLARRLRRADAALEAEVDHAFVGLARPGAAPGSSVLDAPAYKALPDEIALRLLGRALLPAAGGAIGLGKLEALKDALDAAQKAGISRFRRSLAGAMVTLAGGKIVVEPAPPRRAKALTKPKTGSRRGKAAAGKLR